MKKVSTLLSLKRFALFLAVAALALLAFSSFFTVVAEEDAEPFEEEEDFDPDEGRGTPRVWYWPTFEMVDKWNEELNNGKSHKNYALNIYSQFIFSGEEKETGVMYSFTISPDFAKEFSTFEMKIRKSSGGRPNEFPTVTNTNNVLLIKDWGGIYYADVILDGRYKQHIRLGLGVNEHVGEDGVTDYYSPVADILCADYNKLWRQEPYVIEYWLNRDTGEWQTTEYVKPWNVSGCGNKA